MYLVGLNVLRALRKPRSSPYSDSVSNFNVPSIGTLPYYEYLIHLCLPFLSVFYLHKYPVGKSQVGSRGITNNLFLKHPEIIFKKDIYKGTFRCILGEFQYA